MFLQTLSEVDVVEVVEAVDGVAERLVVFLLDEQVVVGIVDSFNVQLVRLVLVKSEALDMECLHAEQQ